MCIRDSRVAQGQGYAVDEDNWQRRMLAIVDVDDEHFYCPVSYTHLDVYKRQTQGCPVHGADIYQDKEFYPWLDELDKPIIATTEATVPYAWKVKCPIGGEMYPSNDFANYDFTSGAFPDDGIGGGYIAPDCLLYTSRCV